MAFTMQQVCDRSRKPLNDADKVRYTDVDLLRYANDCVLTLRRTRPDLFFGQYEALPGDKTIGQNLPVDDEYFPAVCDFVTAMAESKDDENTLEVRVALFFKLFGVAMGAG